PCRRRDEWSGCSSGALPETVIASWMTSRSCRSISKCPPAGQDAPARGPLDEVEPRGERAHRHSEAGATRAAHGASILPQAGPPDLPPPVGLESRHRQSHPSRDGGPMIHQFSVLYVGQIGLEHIGKAGTPADARRYPNERLVEAYRTVVEVSQLMDDLGYDTLWTAEHHFQREGYEVFPNLILLGTYLAAVTRRLRYGCAFNILPMWHPI